MMEPNMINDASELADIIDQLMSGGSGHVNIRSEAGSGVTVDTVKSTDICGIKGACCQPTEDLDDDE